MLKLDTTYIYIKYYRSRNKIIKKYYQIAIKYYLKCKK
nr:hypothetical protein [Enterococcus faecium]